MLTMLMPVLIMLLMMLLQDGDAGNAHAHVFVGPAGGARARSNCSSREEVAGSRAGELLEEGGAGTFIGLCPGLECLSNWLWQARLKGWG